MSVAQIAMTTFQANLSAGVFRQGQVDWVDVQENVQENACIRGEIVFPRASERARDATRWT